MVRGLCPWFLVYGGPNEYSFFCDGPTLPDYVSTMYNAQMQCCHSVGFYPYSTDF